MSGIKFKSTKHRLFYSEMFKKRLIYDDRHRAFFYLIGLSATLRTHINKIYSFKSDNIIREGIDEEWQTKETSKICHLAFSLWSKKNEKIQFTFRELFCDELSSYFIDAIKLRYPEYLTDEFNVNGNDKFCPD